MKAWLRVLKVKLTSNKFKKQLVFGEGEKENFSISVTGTKYLSPLKDEFVVKISNLTYVEQVQIINGEFFNIEIETGYKSSGSETIFKGGVVWVSNNIEDKKTNTVILICASKLVASCYQKRLNISMQSGINMYTALNYIAKCADIRDARISEQFKKRIFDECNNTTGNLASILQGISDNTDSTIFNVDASSGSSFSMFDIANLDSRKIKVNSENVVCSGGYPTINQDGLTMTLLPTFNFQPADILQFDNSLIDMSISNRNEIKANKAYYVDKNGEYIVYQIEYNLTNRSNEFTIQLLCKARSLWKSLTNS